MALGDLFKAKENEQLKARIAQLESMFTPEMRNYVHLQDLINSQQYNLSMLQNQHAAEEARYYQSITAMQNDMATLSQQIAQAKTDLIETNEEALMQYISDHILPYMASMAYSALQYGCAIAGVIVFIVNCKKLKLKKAESELPAGKGLGAAFSNVGMIAALLVCAGLFAMSLAV